MTDLLPAPRVAATAGLWQVTATESGHQVHYRGAHVISIDWIVDHPGQTAQAIADGLNLGILATDEPERWTVGVHAASQRVFDLECDGVLVGEARFEVESRDPMGRCWAICTGLNTAGITMAART